MPWVCETCGSNKILQDVTINPNKQDEIVLRNYYSCYQCGDVTAVWVDPPDKWNRLNQGYNGLKCKWCILGIDTGKKEKNTNIENDFKCQKGLQAFTSECIAEYVKVEQTTADEFNCELKE